MRHVLLVGFLLLDVLDEVVEQLPTETRNKIERFVRRADQLQHLNSRNEMNCRVKLQTSSVSELVKRG